MDDRIAFNVRMPPKLHKFLRKYAFQTEIPMNTIILECVEKFKKSLEKKVGDK